MALAIVSSSGMTRIGWHRSTIVRWTLTSSNYKAVIRRVSKLLIPTSIRWKSLSILHPIIGPIIHHMRCPMRHSVSRNIRSRSRNIHSGSRNVTSISMSMTSRNNRWCMKLRHNRSSNRSTDITCRNVSAQRTTWMRWRVNIWRTRDIGQRDLCNYVCTIPYSHSSQI